MTSERLREVLNAQPFQPFTIHLADGRELPVRHKEFVAISPSGRTMTVFLPDDSMNIVDLLLVTNLHVGGNGKGRGKRSKSR